MTKNDAMKYRFKLRIWQFGLLAAIFISLPFPTLLTCAAGSFILEGNWILTVLVGVVLFSFVGILFFNRTRLIARAHQLNDNRKKKAGA